MKDFFPFHHTDLQDVGIKHPVLTFIIIFNNSSSIYRKRECCASGYLKIVVLWAIKFYFFLFASCIYFLKLLFI